VELLEDQTRATFDLIAAAAGFFQARQAAQQGALAGARASDQDAQTPRRQAQGDAAEHAARAKTLGQLMDEDGLGAHA
jgi:hypothetical protein